MSDIRPGTYVSRMVDQDYLANTQYRNPGNLDTRIDFHAQFSTNKQDWHRWVFDWVLKCNGPRILELGSGSGALWRRNMDRIPHNWEITVSDVSPGMMEEAKLHLKDSVPNIGFAVIDAQDIPNSDEELNVVVANHMLYHVPDREKALREMARVLVPNGILFATTTGKSHLQQMRDLVAQFLPDNPMWGGRPANGFHLETGAGDLLHWFEEVDTHLYPDALLIDDALAFVKYVCSTMHGISIEDDAVVALRSHAEREIAAHGALFVSKSSGLFVGRGVRKTRVGAHGAAPAH